MKTLITLLACIAFATKNYSQIQNFINVISPQCVEVPVCDNNMYYTQTTEQPYIPFDNNFFDVVRLYKNGSQVFYLLDAQYVNQIVVSDSVSFVFITNGSLGLVYINWIKVLRSLDGGLHYYDQFIYENAARKQPYIVNKDVFYAPVDTSVNNVITSRLAKFTYLDNNGNYTKDYLPVTQPYTGTTQYITDTIVGKHLCGVDTVKIVHTLNNATDTIAITLVQQPNSPNTPVGLPLADVLPCNTMTLSVPEFTATQNPNYSHINVYNLSGQLLHTYTKAESPNATIPNTSFLPGIYLLQFIDKNNITLSYKKVAVGF